MAAERKVVLLGDSIIKDVISWTQNERCWETGYIHMGYSHILIHMDTKDLDSNRNSQVYYFFVKLLDKIHQLKSERSILISMPLPYKQVTRE